jgi:hypothetical protein
MNAPDSCTPTSTPTNRPWILLEEWAYIRPWNSETERHAGYGAFLHFYNHHRSHGGSDGQHPQPVATFRDNVPRASHLGATPSAVYTWPRALESNPMLHD